VAQPDFDNIGFGSNQCIQFWKLVADIQMTIKAELWMLSIIQAGESAF
jgi:hypothetical protein